MKLKPINYKQIIKKYEQWLGSLTKSKLVRSIGSCINLSGKSNFVENSEVYLNKNLTPEEKDYIALSSDWHSVGKSLKSFM